LNQTSFQIENRLYSHNEKVAKFNLYTDGGFHDGVAASACILIDNINAKRFKLVAKIATKKSSEAEMFALILGLILADQIIKSQAKKNSCIHWHTDCLGAINVLTKSYLTLAKSIFTCEEDTTFSFSLDKLDLITTHIPPNIKCTNHISCDKACNWVINKGNKLSKVYEDGILKSQQSKASGMPWFYLDLSSTPTFAIEPTISSELASIIRGKLREFLLARDSFLERSAH
jgi:ribonuclease HI